jgi:hypothetical protein
VTDEAVGRPVEPDDPWVAARKEMYPAASLARVAANARYTVATVSLIGAALTALGLVTVASVRASATARVLAAGAVGLALLAVVSALGYLAVRLEKRNYENYVQVRQWYVRQFKRARLVAAASWLLIAAVLLAGAAGLVAAATTDHHNPPVLSLVVHGAADKRSVTAQASVTGLEPGNVVTMRVTGDTGQAFVTGRAVADPAGHAALESTFEDTSSAVRYRLTLTVNDGEGGSIEAP